MSKNNFEEITYQEIFAHIKNKLKSNNLSIKKLSLNCDMDRRSIHRMLNGSREPKVNTLIRIIRDGLNMPLSEFFKDFD